MQDNFTFLVSSLVFIMALLGLISRRPSIHAVYLMFQCFLLAVLYLYDSNNENYMVHIIFILFFVIIFILWVANKYMEKTFHSRRSSLAKVNLVLGVMLIGFFIDKKDYIATVIVNMQEVVHFEYNYGASHLVAIFFIILSLIVSAYTLTSGNNDQG